MLGGVTAVKREQITIDRFKASNLLYQAGRTRGRDGRWGNVLISQVLRGERMREINGRKGWGESLAAVNKKKGKCYRVRLVQFIPFFKLIYI
jgi:hypothetical protein